MPVKSGDSAIQVIELVVLVRRPDRMMMAGHFPEKKVKSQAPKIRNGVHGGGELSCDVVAGSLGGGVFSGGEVDAGHATDEIVISERKSPLSISDRGLSLM